MRDALIRPMAFLMRDFLELIPDSTRLPLPPYYTPRYVEVHSQSLSCIWLSLGLAIVFFGLVVSFVCGHNYVERVTPDISMKFWHDNAVDGGWWYNLTGTPPSSYCSENYTAKYLDDAVWGSHSIGCLREPYDGAQIFYDKHYQDEVRVAFSIAECESDKSDGLCKAEYNTSNVKIYEGIRKSTLTFEPVLFTDYEGLGQYVPYCEAVDVQGRPIANRYLDIHPDKTYGEGFLQLSVEDIVGAAGRKLDDIGSEGASLQLSGLLIMGHVRISNYEFSLNPFSFLSAATKRCKIDFHVLRDEFTVVQTFYERKMPFAVQHGLRLKFRSSGSIGYVSGSVIFSAVVRALLLFGIAQTILDLGWYYFHPEGKDGKLEDVAYHKLYLNESIETNGDGATPEKPKEKEKDTKSTTDPTKQDGKEKADKKRNKKRD